MIEETYIAHTREDGEQSIKSHLENTAKIAQKFGLSFCSGAHAEQIALYHDIGKYSKEFQNRIRFHKGKVDHSTAGAFELFCGKDLDGAICIAGHHSGLQDLGSRFSAEGDGSFAGRMKLAANNGLPDYSLFKREIAPYQKPKELSEPKGFDEFMYIKFLYSCLVDADYLDTEQFMKGTKREEEFDTFSKMYVSLEKYRERFKNQETRLNKLRNRIYCESVSAAKGKGNFYSLSVPTGGGKTLASLGFSLINAINNGKERIIYVIPYTSIIDQTVSIFESIIGTKNVLPHYSEYDFDDQEEEGDYKKLAVENWDSPIIVTTAVQFFESIFSNRPSKCRKIHNIANSVIVFDEYQMIPIDSLKPCIQCIEQLMKNYNCTVLLSTATQPGTERYDVVCEEIVSDVDELYNSLNRVTYETIESSVESLAERMLSKKQVLTIVNTRKTAQEIYEKIAGDDSFHLSTLMPPKIRKQKLKEIKNRLEDGKGCRVVATSLIEAGVDVDFPCVFREENGLDSIIQSAGRCNREFKYSPEDSKVYIVNINKPIPLSQRKNKEAMDEVIRAGNKMASPEMIREYFHILYDLKGEDNLDKDNIMLFSNKLMFEKVNDLFRFIRDDSKTIYIPYDSISQDLISRIKNGERSRAIFRKLGEYGVNVDSDTYSALKKNMSITEMDYVAVLNDLKIFDFEMGLKIYDADTGIGIFI